MIYHDGIMILHDGKMVFPHGISVEQRRKMILHRLEKSIKVGRYEIEIPSHIFHLTFTAPLSCFAIKHLYFEEAPYKFPLPLLKDSTGIDSRR